MEMDDYSATSLQQSSKGSSKKSKSKKKKNNPIKVVYISNPMKVKTSASNFRALVQELTGQDAELPTVPTKFTDTDDDGDGVSCGGGNQKVPDGTENSSTDYSLAIQEVPTVLEQAVHHHQHEQQPSVNTSSEAFEDIFTPQMLENLSGYFPQSLLMN